MAKRIPLLHVLGGGMWQLPTIHLAHALGYRVLVTDMFPQRPAYSIADLHEVVDITDADGTLAVARRHEIQGIVCDTTDAGVPTMAYVAERLGLPSIGVETARRFTDKRLMRRHTAQIQPVRYQVARSLTDLEAAAASIGYPVIVKPADNQSSRGVRRVDDPTGLADAFDDARAYTRQPEILVEELLQGTEVTVEGLMLGGRFYTLAISDKSHFAHRPEVASRLTFPADLPPEMTRRLIETNEAVVRALGLKDGITHAEYMVSDNRIGLVEVAARGGGSRVFSHIAPYVSGIDAPRTYLRFVMGESPKVVEARRRRAANLEFFLFPSGRVTAIRGLTEARALPGVAEVLLEFSVGDLLRCPADDRSRPALAVILGDTRSKVLATTERVRQTLEVEVTS